MVAEPAFTTGTANTVTSTVASDGVGIGGVEYQFCRNTTNSTSGCTTSSWSTAPSATFSSLSDGQIYYYFVRARDSVNNISTWSASTSSTQDATAPTTTITPDGATCMT